MKTLTGKLTLAVSIFSLVAISSLSAEPAKATLFRVSQESSAGVGDFDSNILGFVEDYDTALTASGFYGYNGSFADGANGINLTSNTSHLFLVNASDGLALFAVHDKPNDGSGGSADMSFELLGDMASIVVGDDPIADSYSDTGTVFTSQHIWDPCCTDGMAISSLDGLWTMFGEFTATPSGINNWTFLSDGQTPINLALEPGRRVRIEAIPEPLTILGTATAAGFGAFFKRQINKKKKDNEE